VDHDDSTHGVGARDAGQWRIPNSEDAGVTLPGIDPRPPHESEHEGTIRQRPRRPDDDPVPTPRKRGFWRGVRYLLGGPISAVGVDNIAESASVIRGLAQRIKAGPNVEARVRIFDDRTLDLEAMAYGAGTSVAEVRALLANRRRQTRRAAFSYIAGAVGFFCFWVWHASTTSAYTSLPYVAVLLLMCSLFCLSAFYNALVNWQCRTGRLGTWREFLSTNDSWWPS
jgi:hypothetical protein